MRSHTIVMAICLALSVSLARAETCPNPAFAVFGLHLDTKGVDGTFVRKAALEAATSDAKLSQSPFACDQPAADRLTDLAFEDFIDFVHISSETALAQRYIADIDICFDPVRMRDQFIRRGLSGQSCSALPSCCCRSGKIHLAPGCGPVM